jgi:hypothetical protein
LSEADNAANRRKSQVRAKLEHPFLTLERLRGFAKARHRGLARTPTALLPCRHATISSNGKASHGGGASKVAGNRGNPPRIRPPKAIFPTRIPFILSRSPVRELYRCSGLFPYRDATPRR